MICDSLLYKKRLFLSCIKSILIFALLSSAYAHASTGGEKSKGEMAKALGGSQSTTPSGPTRKPPLPPYLKKNITVSVDPFLALLVAMPDRLKVRVLFRDYFDEFYPVQPDKAFNLPTELSREMLHKCYQAGLIWRMALLLAVKIDEKQGEVSQDELAEYFVQLAFQINRVLRAEDYIDFGTVQKMSQQKNSDFCQVAIPALPGQEQGGESQLLRMDSYPAQVQLGTDTARYYAKGFEHYKNLFSFMRVLQIEEGSKLKEGMNKPVAMLVSRSADESANDETLREWCFTEDVTIESQWYTSGCIADREVSSFCAGVPKKIMKFYLCEPELVRSAFYTLFRRLIKDIYIGDKGQKVSVGEALAVFRRDYYLLVCPMDEMAYETLDVLTVIMHMFIGERVPLLRDRPLRGVKLCYYSDVTPLKSRMAAGCELYSKVAAVGTDPTALDQRNIVERTGSNPVHHVVTLAIKMKSPNLETALVEKEKNIFSGLNPAVAHYFERFKSQIPVQ